MRVLVAEDNLKMAQALATFLEQHQFVVDVVSNGEEALRCIQKNRYDAVLLDLIMPQKNGFEVITALRCLRNAVPVLVLSSLSSVEDRVKVLNLGADDYLVKDFALNELLARLNRLLRRDSGESKNMLYCHTLTLDLSKMTVKRRGQCIHLTKKEFILLVELIRRKHKVVASQDLIGAAWGRRHQSLISNKLNVHMRTLRQKVDRPFQKPLIKTVRGFGYKLTDKEV